MGKRLHNRQVAAQKLGAVVEGIVVSPQLIKNICDEPVDTEGYVRSINQLNDKMTFIKNSNVKLKAYKDVGPVMEKLRMKATERIRHFLLDKIRSLGQSNTNVPVQ